MVVTNDNSGTYASDELETLGNRETLVSSRKEKMLNLHVLQTEKKFAEGHSFSFIAAIL